MSNKIVSCRLQSILVGVPVISVAKVFGDSVTLSLYPHGGPHRITELYIHVQGRWQEFLPTPIKNQDNIYKNFNHEIRLINNESKMSNKKAADAVFVHVETPLPWGLDTTFLLLFRGVYPCRLTFLLFLTPLILDFSDKHTLPCCSFMLKIRYLVYTQKSPNL